MKFITNPLFGVFLSLVVFLIGQWLFKKSNGFFLFQPLFVGMILGIAVLAILAKFFNTTTAIVYTQAYKPGGDIIFWFITPATIAFAVPLYKRNDVVKKNWLVILLGLVVGTFISMILITLVSKAVGLDSVGIKSMLSQSATTAVAMPLTKSIGGNASVTAMACIINAVVIYALGKQLVKWFNLNEDTLGAGLGLGTSGHTVGSAFALELGSVQGAMASVAVVATALVDNLLVPIFSHMIGL
ncbi:LrgB family protein [Lactobacillus sp. ESL0228]|uniref:LrgB family protein n=1 Tax=Lactobacillus sp. ESL0228 TaxID=2069352 RepID=UPI000EFBB05A|nr:LrgB family protein [Lactobacillus sp. ESL0228]RMC47252.1 antiholin LrgB [Lactobacillus sp. ESL0228]